MIACHDRGAWVGASNRAFWPFVLEQLVGAQGRDAKALKRRLHDHHTGLPRGRVTHPKSGYIAIHSYDASVDVPDWPDQVKARFRLTGVKVTP